ncbi:hypothetical protein DXZ75_38665 [Streptomyces sp. AcE210]|nr:hypothetical protein DXZ75_38665 [Streptomyces sp. AcE210]
MARAPPPIISQRRRRARASDASASAAQSGPCEPPLPPEPHWGPPCPKLMGRILDRRAGGAAAWWGRVCAGSGRSCVRLVCGCCVPGVTPVRCCLRRRAVTLVDGRAAQCGGSGGAGVQVRVLTRTGKRGYPA